MTTVSYTHLDVYKRQICTYYTNGFANCKGCKYSSYAKSVKVAEAEESKRSGYKNLPI